jgi:putative oxidoreductase
MKKYPPIVAGVLLGLLFLMASVTYFLNMVPEQKIPEGTPTAMFMGAFGPTGYMTFVKVFELVGGILVMIPRLRNLGLLLLGPVIVNILAYNFFVADIKDLLNPMAIIMSGLMVVLSLYLLWVGRKNFSALIN